MPLIYEVPTHLNVKDEIVFGLGVHQLVRLAAGAAAAYSVWDQAVLLPAEARASIAVGLMAIGVVCALLQPAGRPLDQWMLAIIVYVLSPRRFAWRHAEQTLVRVQAHDPNWAELDADPNWVGPCISAANPRNTR
jgi:hypothetical protein